MTSKTSESELLEQELPSASDSHSDSLLLSSGSTKDKLPVQLPSSLCAQHRVPFKPVFLQLNSQMRGIVGIVAERSFRQGGGNAAEATLAPAVGPGGRTNPGGGSDRHRRSHSPSPGSSSSLVLGGSHLGRAALARTCLLPSSSSKRS